MEIKRGVLAAIVVEEVRRRLAELVEADDGSEDEDPPKKKGSKKPSTASADMEQPRKGPTSAGPKANTGSPDVSSPDLDQDASPDGPAVDGDQPDPDAVDSDGDGGEDATGAVNDEVSGKTVQAVTIEPKSKVLPGAKEVVIAFNESTDTLRILCTPTGTVKFFWRGQLFDIP